MSDRFLSVPTMIRGRYRHVEGPSSPHLYGGAMPTDTSALREEMLSSLRQPDLMLRFLAEIDRKLDAVLAMMQRESLAGEFPHEAHIVELSGSHLVMESSEALSRGDFLEVLILLDEYPMRMVSTIASVADLKSGPALTGPSHHIHSLNYVDITEEDREAVIRFVFSEERKRIRQQKGDG